MSRQLWGCYAVGDHKVRRAFVSDVLLYERLVVPVPPPDEPDEFERWRRRGWEPGRQAELLAVLGGVAEKVPWSARRRSEWQAKWRSASVASDVEHSAAAAEEARQTGVAPIAAHITREVLTDELTTKVFTTPDIRALAVYASPLKFDSDWRIERTLPFVRRERRAVPANDHEVERPEVGDDRYRLARVLVAEFAVPNDPNLSDAELLRRALDLAYKPTVADWRQSFHEWLHDISDRGLSDLTLLREMTELVNNYNASVMSSKLKLSYRVGTILLGAIGAISAAFWAPLAGLSKGGPVAAVGGAVVDRIYAGVPAERVKAGALLAEARRSLR